MLPNLQAKKHQDLASDTIGEGVGEKREAMKECSVCDKAATVRLYAAVGGIVYTIPRCIDHNYFGEPIIDYIWLQEKKGTNLIRTYEI